MPEEIHATQRQSISRRQKLSYGLKSTGEEIVEVVALGHEDVVRADNIPIIEVDDDHALPDFGKPRYQVKGAVEELTLSIDQAKGTAGAQHRGDEEQYKHRLA